MRVAGMFVSEGEGGKTREWNIGEKDNDVVVNQ
jgi:hypothetical protein